MIMTLKPMKTLFTITLISIFGIFSLAADEGQLNKELEERIKANQALTEVLIEYAKVSEFKAELVPLEKKSGVFWTDYIKHVIESKDLKLKVYVLRTEYNQEIVDALYELEYEEDAEAKPMWKAKASEFRAKLEKLEKTALKLGVVKPARGEKTE